MSADPETVGYIALSTLRTGSATLLQSYTNTNTHSKQSWQIPVLTVQKLSNFYLAQKSGTSEFGKFMRKQFFSNKIWVSSASLNKNTEKVVLWCEKTLPLCEQINFQIFVNENCQKGLENDFLRSKNDSCFNSGTRENFDTFRDLFGMGFYGTLWFCKTAGTRIGTTSGLDATAKCK